MDPCHLIPQQRLRRAGVSREDIWDPRVIVAGCRHHHGLIDRKLLAFPLEAYPPELIDYAAEHGFYWAGERDGWRKEAPAPSEVG